MGIRPKDRQSEMALGKEEKRFGIKRSSGTMFRGEER